MGDSKSLSDCLLSFSFVVVLQSKIVLVCLTRAQFNLFDCSTLAGKPVTNDPSWFTWSPHGHDARFIVCCNSVGSTLPTGISLKNSKACLAGLWESRHAKICAWKELPRAVGCVVGTTWVRCKRKRHPPVRRVSSLRSPWHPVLALRVRLYTRPLEQ